MTLAERREQWEKGLTVKTVLVHNDIANYETIFVVLQNDSGNYSLHRYFSIGYVDDPNWEVSVDLQDKSLGKVFERLKEEFNDLLPR